MKKGFTLIELIAVIAILGIVLVIVVPNVVNTINNSKDSLSKEQKNQIISAARNWGLENAESSTNNYVTIKELQDKGYLESNTVKNLTDKTDLDVNTKVCFEYKNNQYVYTFKGDC